MATIPTINIIFKQLASTLIERTGQQTVVLLMDKYENTDTKYYVEASLLSEIETSQLSTVAGEKYEEIYKAIELCFGNSPKRVIISNLGFAETWTELLASDYTNCVICGITDTMVKDTTTISTIKSLAENSNYGVNVVTTTSDLTTGGLHSTHIHCVAGNEVMKLYDTAGEVLTEGQKVALISGAIACCGIERSLTNYTLPLISTVELVSTYTDTAYTTAVANGVIIAKITAGKPRVVSGVNTAEVSGNITEDMQHIEVICTMDTIAKDISDTFANYYRGAYKNNYDRQLLFISAINEYFRQLANEEALDPSFDNKSYIDVEEQRSAWIAKGKAEAKDWSDDKVRVMSFGRQLFIGANIKICQSMEDLQMVITLE